MPRRCVGCGLSMEAAKLVRVVVDQGHLRVDVKKRLGGRGASSCPSLGCIARGIERGGFARVLRASVHSSDPVVFAQGMLEEIRRSHAGIVEGVERGKLAPESGQKLESLRRWIDALEVDETAGWELPTSGRRKRRKKGHPNNSAS
jgi:predicted RNA-binding protein YlxR (DUF448 family)